MPASNALGNERLRDYSWQLSYSTSAQTATGKPLDILHQFYIPVLKRCHRYDRVAGYFRSTSLAAASQGFSAFVGRQGRMRMVVGADLDPEDVRAVLDGTEEALTIRLSRELVQPEQWPEAVQRGVELLAWMVARSFLDIRVAFRVHARTGEPLTTDSRADGYVHEKWALFRDEAGDRLYVTGSFNESRTALVHNAENIDVHRDWTSEENRQRADEAEARFERVWNNENPSLLVLSLPEAVRQRLVQLAERVRRPTEIDSSSEAPLNVPSPSPLEWLRFALLRDGPKLPDGRYVGMATAPIEPWPHQAVVARRLIDTWPYSYLLCDEVGLGKTIEAGLAIRSLYLAGLVKRVLICPPASLTRQWQRELASKFLLPFGRALGGRQARHEYLFPFAEERSAHSLYAPDLTIVSTGLLVRQEQRVYDLLEDYCSGLARQLQRTPGNRNSFVLGMILSFLRLRFASSLFAIRETLRRRLDKVNATLQHLTMEEDEEPDELALTDLLEEGEDDQEAVILWFKHRTPADLEWEQKKLTILLRELADLTTTPSKLQRLLEYLSRRRLAGGRLRQTVIFTRFYDTLTDIVKRLLQVEPNLLVGTYSGRGGAYLNPKTHHLLGCSREEIKQRFLRNEIDVLVCTDAAAEGLNLQTADLLINFDLPWNPMKVEQRIGRIDQIGQRHTTVSVSNLCYLNFAEEIVYGRLLKRLEQAGAIMGTQQPSLLPVTPEEFRDLAGGTLQEEALSGRSDRGTQ